MMSELSEIYNAHKELHKQRVSKNSDRVEYAIEQFKKCDIEFVLKNKENGHFHCRRKSDDLLIQFWASTGKIIGVPTKERGIHNLIQILNN